ncbi:MAG TPA: YbjN domain-containing protein [Urbifossiella sp.]|nr:YbjN domain-containing protein [Urbifossiella sp.]
MPKRFAFLVVCLLLPGMTRAQDAPLKNFTPADFENVIKTELKLEFDDSSTPTGKRYEIVGTPYYATFNEKDKYLIFYALYPKQKLTEPATLDRINDWNKKAVYSRAFLATGGNSVKYEAAMSVAAGLANLAGATAHR